jgi:photosystem II stability/assembly factor-like uncharacterized protein
LNNYLISKEYLMRLIKMLTGFLLALAVASCTQVQVPPTVTPVSGTNTPTPVIILETPTSVSTAANTPLGTQTNMPVMTSPGLVHIAFLDANNGWGVASNDGGHILRTVNGGTTWQNVTPVGVSGIGLSTTLSVLDSNTAWVLVPNADFFTGTLYRTSDSGTTWTSFQVPFGGGSIKFLDANTGRVLADLGAGAGSQGVELFQSSDGGATWLSVYNNDPTRPDSSNTLPLGGIKNGMTFLDANTGWVTGTRPVDGEVYLFVTRDGGISWEEQTITLPSDYSAFQYMPQPPIFFGNEGFLPLGIFMNSSTDFTFFVTHDGGTTWSGNPTNSKMVIKQGSYAFADAMHGWSWDGGATVNSTSDGAQTWNGVTTNIDLSGRLSQMVFVPGTGGQFIGWALTGQDDAGQSQLYKTTDNGGTWNLIP